MNCQDAQTFLGAYVDGELDLVRSLEVEAHVEGCPGCAWERHRLEELSAAIATLPRFPASPELRRRVGRRHALPGRWAAHGGALLAASLAVAGFLLWRYIPARTATTDVLTEQVVQDHVRSLMANHLLDVAALQPVEPWFADKLNYAPAVEGMPWRGFTLMGGRLDYLGGRAVAALVYQHGSHIINIFVWPVSGQPDRSPRSRPADGFQVVSWRADGMDWWAVSDLSHEELEELPMCPCFMPPNRTLRVNDNLKPRLD